MKRTPSCLFILLFFCFGSFSLFADGHPDKLKAVGERIKQAVKAGKISEKEGWAKWHAVKREFGRKDKHDHDDRHDDEWEEAEELKREIEIRALEHELDRMERDHERERREWEHEMERMRRDFDRERRQWEMENRQWDMRRKQMEMQMRGGPGTGVSPPHGGRPSQGMKPPHPHHGAGPKPDMHRSGPPKGMFPPVGKGPGIRFGNKPSRPDFHRMPFDHKGGFGPLSNGKPDCGKSACGKSEGKPDCGKGKSDCGNKDGKSCCGKCRSGFDKKESCPKGQRKKSTSCPKKDSSCKKGEKSSPDEIGDCPKGGRD